MSSNGYLDPPPGYGSIVPFDRDEHRGLIGPRDYRFAGALHGIYVTVQEFFRAAAHYPIVFFSPAPTRWLPLALTGLTVGKNLFVDEQGEWRHGTYVPAYVRRYPFCTATNADPNDPETQFIVYVDKDALRPVEPPAQPFFDFNGDPTEAWSTRERLIREMEAARVITEAFAAQLEKLALFEPFEAHAQPVRGAPMLVRGLFRVSEDRLNTLSGEAVKELMVRGELSRIYAHLMSLDNFAALLDLHAPATG